MPTPESALQGLLNTPVRKSRKPGINTLNGEHYVVSRIFRISRLSIRQLFSWATKVCLALLDQGFISGTHFLISILLARWFGTTQYGAYALAFAIYLLLMLLYQSLLLEPMAVFGGGMYRHSLAGYIRTLLWLHLFLSVGLFTTLGTAAFVAHYVGKEHDVARALAGMAIAAPCALLFGLIRRAFYLNLKVIQSLAGSSVYCALVISGLFVTYRHGRLSPFSAYLIMAAAALVASALLLYRLRTFLCSAAASFTLKQIWWRHWEYGRWALAGCIAAWIPVNIYYLVLSSFSGMLLAGQLKAIMNFDLPVQQSYAALSMLFLPYVAQRICRDSSRSNVLTLVRHIQLLFICGAVAYWAAVIAFRVPMLRLFYSEKYIDMAYLLPFLAIESILWSATAGSAVILRAMGSSFSVFLGRCAASMVTLSLGIAATRAFGLQGVVVTMVVASAANVFTANFLLRKKAGERPPVMEECTANIREP